MTGAQFVAILEMMIGAEATRHCVAKIGGELDEPHFGSLTTYEALALYVYSNASSWHADINRQLWSGVPSAEVRVFAAVLNSCLQKLPALTGMASLVYRGLRAPDLDAFAESYVPRREVVFRGFTSATYREEAAFGGNVLFIIRSQSARSVWFLSAHFYEEEVLLPTDRRFDVMGAELRGGRLLVRLQEVQGG